jgi:hypothetical protein
MVYYTTGCENLQLASDYHSWQVQALTFNQLMVNKTRKLCSVTDN